jgi:putative Mg2+ transporter-C (MgtC) family protein
MWREAVAGAVIVVAGNWFLQPLGTRLDRMTTKGGREVTPAEYRLSVVCGALTEADVKALVAQALPAPHFRLRALQSLPVQAADQTELRADYTTAVRDDQFAEDAIRTLSRQAGVTSVRWSLLNEQAADWTS